MPIRRMKDFRRRACAYDFRSGVGNRVYRLAVVAFQKGLAEGLYWMPVKHGRSSV